MAPSKRALPSKEAAIFKEILTQYEMRQLKKAIKNADLILKKFPEHGETLAMKGLCLTQSGKKDEGIELVKRGVRLDLMSHIVWHVYGLIHREDKNYEEALKSYTQALRFDRDNINILRDSAHLQTHLRAFDQLVDTRTSLIRLRPAVRHHWIGLAVAHHLNGNPIEAHKVLEHYESTLKNVPDYDVEHSETLLYHVRVLEDIGDLPSALSLLDINAKLRTIVDRTAIMESRARLLSGMKDPEAAHAWQALIEKNPDCTDYYRGFLASKGVHLDAPTPTARTQGLDILRSFAEQLPRATAPRRLALSLAEGAEFKSLLTPYLHAGLIKGIPSIFADLKSLYGDSEKRSIVQAVAEEFLAACTPPGSEAANSATQSVERDPSAYLWTLYFLAQHHSHRHRVPTSAPRFTTAPLIPTSRPIKAPRLLNSSEEDSSSSPGASSSATTTEAFAATSTFTAPASKRHSGVTAPLNLPEAISLLTTALTHTPTLPELHVLRSRVLKRAGDPIRAAAAVEEARRLDGQDRYLNWRSGIYALRTAGLEGLHDGPAAATQVWSFGLGLGHHSASGAGGAHTNGVNGTEPKAAGLPAKDADAIATRSREGAAQIEDAVRLLGMFTKKDPNNPIHPAADLEDMQSMLFLTEEAAAELRTGRVSMALKRYLTIDKVFGEIVDDQYDFHGYSLRKFTINIYLNLLKWEDQLRSHPAYVIAALQASRIYVAVHDNPAVLTAAAASVRLSDAEKKARKKAKKAAQKVQDDKKPAAGADDVVTDNGPTKDEDPDGLKALGAPDGLERAAKLLQPLQTYASSNVDVWIVVYDVAVRRKKYLQAVQALNRAKALDEHHPELHVRLVDLKQRVSNLPQSPPAPIGPLLTSSLEALFPADLTPEALNAQYLQQRSGSAPAAFAAARVLHKLGASREEVEGLVFATLQHVEGQATEPLDVKFALTVLGFLNGIGSARADEYREACAQRFELSTIFKTSKEISALKQRIKEEGLSEPGEALAEAEVTVP
ncbi:hypothetical protein HGRIS_000299 [Hohenbuehelia grisea]|uniref:Uncharacterized protein n=1 Tax=Hohenbuehelia grisea TaxID=104357 RepID=A0ABR3JRE9_9AGAR